MTNILNSCNNITTIQPRTLHIVNCNIKGNLIPSDWYKIITTKTGRPDHAAITLLAEVIYWYRPAKYKKTRAGYDDSNNASFNNSHNNSVSLKFLGDAWQSSYQYLSNKFKLSHETIRRAFVKLEDMGFIKRDFRTVHLRGQRYNNSLFILLGDKIWQLFTKSRNDIADIVSNKNKNSFVETTKSSLSDTSNNSSNDFSANTANPSFSLPKYEDPSPQIVGDHYIDNKNKKNNNIKSRSNESKFCKNLKEKKLEEILEEPQVISKEENTAKEGRGLVLPIELTTEADASIKLPSVAKAPMQNIPNPAPSSGNNEINNETNTDRVEKQSYITFIATNNSALNEEKKKQELLPLNSNIVNKIKARFKFRSTNKKPLESFYPITVSEASSLRFESGREFDANYINKLMLHLAKKCPNNSFYGRKQVLAYLAKALHYELRQSPAVNNLSFRFKSEINTEEAKIEKYLSEIEYSKDTSEESQLRKKIAGVFEPEFAYELLTNITISSVESPAIMTWMNKMINFDQGKIELLLAQVKAVYGLGIERIDIICDGEEYVMSAEKGIVKLPKLSRLSTASTPPKLPSMSIKNKAVDNACATNDRCRQIAAKANTTEEVNTPQAIQNPLWMKIRAKLINRYGEATDKSWFSKLAPIEEDKQDKDKQSNGLALRAPTGFIKSWIESNYLSIICRFAKEELYENYREIKIIGPENRNYTYV